MDIPNYATLIFRLGKEIDLITSTFISGGYKAMSSAMQGPVAAMCVLYIVLTGFSITRGLIKKPMDEFVKVSIRIGIVYMLAFNWGTFSAYFVGLFVNGAGELGAVMMKATPLTLPEIDGITSAVGINGTLQSALIEVVRVGLWTWEKGSLTHAGPLFTGFLIWASGMAVVGLAFFEIIVAKLMIAVCMTTAPLFLSFTLFDKTRTYFDRWLDKLVGFSLVLVMVSSVVGLCMHLLHWSIGGHYINKAVGMTTVDWIPLLLVSCLCVMLILQVVGIAKSIGGMCSTGTGSAMIGGAIGGAMGVAATSGGLMKKGADIAGMNPSKMATNAGRAFGQDMAEKGSHALKRGGEMMSSIHKRMRGEWK
jgi:type IV secretion system protein VirB6